MPKLPKTDRVVPPEFRTVEGDCAPDLPVQQSHPASR